MQRRFYNNKATPVDIGVLFELTLCRKRAVTLKIKSLKTFIEQPKIDWHSACDDSFTRKGELQ